MAMIQTSIRSYFTPVHQPAHQGKRKLTDHVFYHMVQEGHIKSLRDICNLRLTCRSISTTLELALYRRDIITSLRRQRLHRHDEPENPPDGERLREEPSQEYSPLGDDESSDDDYDWFRCYKSDEDAGTDDDNWDYDEEHFKAHQAEMSTYIKKHRAHFLQRPTTRSLKTTSLHWAAANGYLDMLGKILGQIKKKDFYKQFLDLKIKGAKTALVVAAENGRDDVVKMLIEAGAFVDAPSPYSTSYTRRYCGSHIRDMDPDHPNYYGERQRQFCTPLGHAIRSGNESTAIILASHTEHLNNHGFGYGRTILSPLTLAVRHEMYGVIKTLLSRGYQESRKSLIDPEHPQRESDPLCIASSIENNQRMIKFLIDHGIGIDTNGAWGWCPLVYAIYTNRVENALYLLSCEESDYIGSRIQEAFQESTRHDDNLEITKALAERLNSFGAFLCLIGTIRDMSPAFKRRETIRYCANLLASGLNKTYIREDQTYVHWLLEDSKGGAKFGADLNFVMEHAGDKFDIHAKDKDGLTGLDLARKYNNWDMIDYLSKKMEPPREDSDEEVDDEAEDEAGDEGSEWWR
ncbi:ankyrin repeat-containing domain protein [Rostrohypoxylon terebratum]|nr:ankyrin repeat-containing domain protein [Rostrohypoxylon terebratum]